MSKGKQKAVCYREPPIEYQKGSTWQTEFDNDEVIYIPKLQLIYDRKTFISKECIQVLGSFPCIENGSFHKRCTKHIFHDKNNPTLNFAVDLIIGLAKGLEETETNLLKQIENQEVGNIDYNRIINGFKIEITRAISHTIKSKDLASQIANLVHDKQENSLITDIYNKLNELRLDERIDNLEEQHLDILDQINNNGIGTELERKIGRILGLESKIDQLIKDVDKIKYDDNQFDELEKIVREMQPVINKLPSSERIEKLIRDIDDKPKAIEQQTYAMISKLHDNYQKDIDKILKQLGIMKNDKQKIDESIYPPQVFK